MLQAPAEDFLFLWIISLFSRTSCDIDLVRNTSYGPVMGFLSEALSGQKVEQYLGIPYAAPPIGELRFEDTLPPRKWTGTRDCTSLPPACPQNPDMDYIQRHSPNFSDQNEDCLYLNVYVPKRRGATLLPVLVYIHGGSNRVGMGAMLRGDILAGYGDILVVNFNYRLGSLGFYAAQEHGLTGNYGFLDQLMALEWVRNNIENFGGDPARVTVAGHSAGAADTGFHVVSPMSEGLFQQAMIMSGSPLAFWGIAAPDWPKGTNIKPNCHSYLCPNNAHADLYPTVKEYLRALPWRDFTVREYTPTPVSYREVLTFPVAIVDGQFIPERPEELLKKGRINGKNFVFSFTRDEGAWDVIELQNVFESFKVMNEKKFGRLLNWYKPIYPYVSTLTELVLHEYGGWELYPNNGNHDSICRRLTEMESDIVFIAPMVRMADLLAQHTDNIKMFTFDHVSSYTQKPVWQGAPHGEDLFYIFGIPFVGFEYPDGRVDVPYTEVDKNVSKIMMALWSNFVKYGNFSVNPEKGDLKYGGQSRAYTKIETIDNVPVITEHQNYKPRRMAFWNDLLPSISLRNKSGQCSSGQSSIFRFTKADVLVILLLLVTLQRLFDR